jgi:hypothetical protein
MPNGGPLRMGHSAPPNKRMQLAGARAVALVRAGPQAPR